MNKNESYRSTLIRIASFFIAFYIVMMVVFTFFQFQSIKTEYSIRSGNALSSLGLQIPRIISEFADKNEKFYTIDENLETELFTSLNLFTRGFCSEYSYIKAALFTLDGKLIAKSCNLLRCCTNVMLDSNSSYAVYHYMDMDKYLTKEQILFLYQLNKSQTRERSYMTYVEGYVRGAEIIPSKIVVKEENWSLIDEKSANLLSETIIKEWHYNAENIEGLEHYMSLFSEPYFEMLLTDNYTDSLLTNDIIDNFQLCNDALDYQKSQVKEGMILDITEEKNSINFSKRNSVYQFQAEGKSYILSISTVYYPLSIAASTLMTVYAFSFIMVVILSLILAKKLWDIYKTQQQLQKSRRDMTNSISHELKTPLAIIKSYSEGLLENIAEDKKEHYINVIIDETTKMDNMVMELLDLSKLEAKAYILQTEEFSMNSLARSVIEEKVRVLKDNKVIISFIEEREWTLEADYKRMEQVMSNLISNAISFTREGGKIIVSIGDKRASVENEGVHIPTDRMHLVWESFYKEDSSRERQHKGTGLGLAIVKNILELHGMKYGVNNTDSGVRFWFGF